MDRVWHTGVGLGHRRRLVARGERGQPLLSQPKRSGTLLPSSPVAPSRMTGFQTPIERSGRIQQDPAALHLKLETGMEAFETGRTGWSCERRSFPLLGEPVIRSKTLPPC